IMGKPPVVYNFTDIGKFVWESGRSRRPSVYESMHIAKPQAGYLSGFTQTVRREIAHLVPFSTKAKSVADSGVLQAAKQRGDLQCARADVMNAAIERGSDPNSHAWNAVLNAERNTMIAHPMCVSAVLDPGEPCPPPLK